MSDRNAAQQAFIERIVGYCYSMSCHHGEDHAMADPTLHCCDFAELVWAYEAIQQGRYGDVERIFVGEGDNGVPRGGQIEQEGSTATNGNDKRV